MGNTNLIKIVHNAIINSQAAIKTGNLYLKEKINYIPYIYIKFLLINLIFIKHCFFLFYSFT